MPPRPFSPPVTSVQRNATAYSIAASASVSNEKYTPRRRRIRNPNAVATAATIRTPAIVGPKNESCIQLRSSIGREAEPGAVAEGHETGMSDQNVQRHAGQCEGDDFSRGGHGEAERE